MSRRQGNVLTFHDAVYTGNANVVLSSLLYPPFYGRDRVIHIDGTNSNPQDVGALALRIRHPVQPTISAVFSHLTPDLAEHCYTKPSHERLIAECSVQPVG